MAQAIWGKEVERSVLRGEAILLGVSFLFRSCPYASFMLTIFST